MRWPGASCTPTNLGPGWTRVELRRPWPRRSQHDRDCAVRPGTGQSEMWMILAQGWHPYMRYPKNVTFCAEGGRRLPARAFVPRPDTAWTGIGTAFSKATVKRRCTLLAVWYVEQEEPWIILTDLPPDEVGVSWYGSASGSSWGSGQELGLAMAKDPQDYPARISRHWFVLSVATLLGLGPGWKTPPEAGPRLLAMPPRALLTAVAGRSRDGPSA